MVFFWEILRVCKSIVVKGETPETDCRRDWKCFWPTNQNMFCDKPQPSVAITQNVSFDQPQPLGAFGSKSCYVLNKNSNFNFEFKTSKAGCSTCTHEKQRKVFPSFFCVPAFWRIFRFIRLDFWYLKKKIPLFLWKGQKLASLVEDLGSSCLDLSSALPRFRTILCPSFWWQITIETISKIGFKEAYFEIKNFSLRGSRNPWNRDFFWEPIKGDVP